MTGRHLLLTLLLTLGTAGCISGNGFIAGQLRDKAMEEQLLKPGALDPAISGGYETYSYKFLGRYRVSHDWLGSARPCHYNAIHSGTATHRAARAIRDGDIYETDGHTYQEFFQPKYPERSSDPRYLSIDRHVRPEYTLKDGTKMKGFQSVCFEAWGSTHHFLSVFLNKRKLDKPNIYGRQDGEISYQVVGKNKWWVQKFDLTPRTPSGGYGRIVESWVLPIADTGYIFIFEFGANIESQNNPAAHARMQATFRHLIESVKIEPLQ